MGGPRLPGVRAAVGGWRLGGGGGGGMLRVGGSGLRGGRLGGEARGRVPLLQLALAPLSEAAGGRGGGGAVNEETEK